MHLLLAIILIVLVFWKGDWRNWKKYRLTIYYVLTCNLLYNLLCKNKMLWEYVPKFYPSSHIITDLIYTFINLPAITLLYLTYYPLKKPLGKQLVYVFMWITGSTIIEYPIYKLGHLHLDHGYQYWMEPFFYTAMYTMMRLHFTRPFWAYGISVIIITFLLKAFNIPLK